MRPWQARGPRPPRSLRAGTSVQLSSACDCPFRLWMVLSSCSTVALGLVPLPLLALVTWIREHEEALVFGLMQGLNPLRGRIEVLFGVLRVRQCEEDEDVLFLCVLGRTQVIAGGSAAVQTRHGTRGKLVALYTVHLGIDAGDGPVEGEVSVDGFYFD